MAPPTMVPCEACSGLPGIRSCPRCHGLGSIVAAPDACDYCDMGDEDFDDGDVPPLLTYTDDARGATTRCHAECYAEMVAEGGHGDQIDAERARLAAIVGVP